MGLTKPRGHAATGRNINSATGEPWFGDRWEYRTMSMKITDQDAMSEMGSAGWELISVVPVTIGGTGGAWLANTVWKRRRVPSDAR